MFWFAHKAAAQRVVVVRPAAIEGLEGRCLLSGSPMSTGSDMHVDNSGPSVKMPQQNPSSGKQVNTVVQVEGVATTIDVTAGKITLADEHSGALTTFTIPTTVTVTVKDSSTGGLGAIKAGAEVHITLSAVDGSVLSVSAENPSPNKGPGNGNGQNNQNNQVEGVVKSVDTVAGTLTVTAEHSTTPTVFTIPSTAKIIVNGKHATLADITAGSNVEIHFSPVDGTTILSVEVGTDI